MSDLQARLDKLRASNQALKAISDRIDSSKVLAANVVAELDEVIVSLPEAVSFKPTAAPAPAPAPAPASVPAPVLSVEVPEVVEVVEVSAEAESEPVFVRDEAPQVAGVTPVKVEVPEEEASPGHAEESLQVEPPSKVRREGGA